MESGGALTSSPGGIRGATHAKISGEHSTQRKVSAKGLAQTRVHSEAREAPGHSLTTPAAVRSHSQVLGMGVMLGPEAVELRAGPSGKKVKDYSTKPARSGVAAGAPEMARMVGTGFNMKEGLGSDRP